MSRDMSRDARRARAARGAVAFLVRVHARAGRISAPGERFPLGCAMANTLKESTRTGEGPPVRLITVVTHYDDLLHPPRVIEPWGGEPLVLGRGETDHRAGAFFSLRDPRVSTRHAELQVDGGEVLVRDLGSSNGTFVDGQPVGDWVRVDDGAVLELGRTVLVVRAQSASSAKLVLDGEAPGATLGSLVTLHPGLAEVFARLRKAVSSPQSVLLVGETGTGKDVLAHELHALSRRSGAFVAIDCGAVPDNLFESTLFGHEKSAFTGAATAREGEVVRAHRGTFFLDEVGNLTPSAQAKLLRVIETSEVTPLGGSRAQKVDVRWLAATNRTVLEHDDAFRSDLLHRLAGVVVALPPLRERREDLGLLMAALLSRAGVREARLSPQAGRSLMLHALPGNVRQLRNVLQRAANGETAVVIDEEALGALELNPAPSPSSPRKAPEPEAGKGRVKQPTQSELEAALRAADGVVAEAARALGTSSRQLYRWLDKFGLAPETFRQA